MDKLPRPSILTVDVGSSSIKAAIVAADGQIHALRARPTPYLAASPPAFTVDMDAIWATALALLREVVAQVGSKEIDAIAVTALGDGTWLLDCNGRPAGPALLWRDGRSSTVLDRWQREGRLEQVAYFTGTKPTTAHQTTQLAWLAESAPQILQQARHVLFAEDWIGYALTGEIAVCQSNYEHTYGHLSQAGRDRQAPLNRVLEILDLTWVLPLLPEPKSSLEVRGGLSREAGSALGLPAGLPVFAGPFDVLTAALGSGAVAPEQACSIWGTAAIHQRWTSSFQPAEPGYLVCHPQDSRRWLRFVATSAGMTNLDYWRHVLYASDPSTHDLPWPDLEANVAKIPPGADGLIYLPYLTASGERSERVGGPPGAGFLGIHEGHGRHHYLRAVYEGLAIQAARTYRRLTAAGQPLREIRVSGGGGQSNLLAQILAHATGLTVTRTANREAGLLGTAMLAMTGLGYFKDIDTFAATVVRPERVFAPDPKQSEQYRQISGKVDALLASLAHFSADSEDQGRLDRIETPSVC